MSAPFFADYLGANVVVDTRSRDLAYLGRLEAVTEDAVVLADADVHDMRESNTAREVYVMEAKKYGIQANRREVRIRLGEVVSISKLDDVIAY